VSTDLKTWGLYAPDPEWRPGENRLKNILRRLEICEVHPRDATLPGKAIASIHITPDLPEKEALALADRVEADPDLIGMHPSVIDLRKLHASDAPKGGSNAK